MMQNFILSAGRNWNCAFMYWDHCDNMMIFDICTISCRTGLSGTNFDIESKKRSGITACGIRITVRIQDAQHVLFLEKRTVQCMKSNKWF